MNFHKDEVTTTKMIDKILDVDLRDQPIKVVVAIPQSANEKFDKKKLGNIITAFAFNEK